MQRHFDYWQQFFFLSLFFGPLPSTEQISSPCPGRLLHPWEQFSAQGSLEVQKDPADWLQERSDGTFRWEGWISVLLNWVANEWMNAKKIFSFRNVKKCLFRSCRFTVKDLLPTRLLWFPSLRIAAAGVRASKSILETISAKRKFHLFCFYTHLQARHAGTEMIVIMMDYSDLPRADSYILTIRFCLLMWNFIKQD